MYGYDIFHEDILNNLINNLRCGNNASTYIFEGHSGLNKKEAALLFAKALVCEKPNTAPCCQCSACIEAQAGTHPDIIFVKRPDDKTTLGVDPIREMIGECLIKPFYNRHKVFIIDEGDLLTPAAQNAFLKIIEEPPEYSVFIIICTGAEILLQTVRSRAVIITFPPVSDDIVKQYIEKKYPDEARLDFLVGYCEGIPKAADNIIARSDFETLRENTLKLTAALLSANKNDAFTVSKCFDDNKSNASELCDMILMYLRDIMIVALGCPEKTVNIDKADTLHKLAQKHSTALLAKAIDEVVLTKKMLNRHVKASAAILHAALNIVG